MRRVRYRLEYAGLAFAAWLLPKLPLTSLRHIAQLLGSVAFTFDKRGRQVALENLTMVFGEEKSAEEIRQIARKSYCQFARTMLELFWASNLRADNHEKYVQLDGYEHLRDACKDGRGVIALCLHYGNFEWDSVITGFHVTQGLVVTQEFRNPLLGPVFDRLRGSGGHRIIPQERSVMATLKHLKKGGSVGILIDLQLHPRDNPCVPVRAFGRLRPMTEMHAILHKHTGLPIVPLENIPLPDGRYRCVAHKPLFFSKETSNQEIVQKCWDLFEVQMRRQPEAWLWAYKHWRFLPENDPPSYPSYARRDKHFDRLLEESQTSSETPHES